MNGVAKSATLITLKRYRPSYVLCRRADSLFSTLQTRTGRSDGVHLLHLSEGSLWKLTPTRTSDAIRPTRLGPGPNRPTRREFFWSKVNVYLYSSSPRSACNALPLPVRRRRSPQAIPTARHLQWALSVISQCLLMPGCRDGQDVLVLMIHTCCQQNLCQIKKSYNGNMHVC